MRIPSITVDMLVALVAVAQDKNLEVAGKELGLSPSAVHKRIQAANRFFGRRLFVVKNEGMQLTEVGEILYSHAVRALEQVLLAEELTIAAVELISRQLLVGHSTYLTSRLLAIIHKLDLGSSGIRLQHKPGLTRDLVQNVCQGTLHAGIGYLPVVGDGLLVYQLTEEPLVVCMPRMHRLAVKPIIRPHDLEGEPIIAVAREPFPAMHREIDEFFQDFGITLQIIADAFGPPEAEKMVEQQVGLCLLSPSNCRGEMVVAKPLTPQTLTRKCGLFVREDNRHPALKAFVDLLLEATARRLPPS
jgi:DNA-binding transcriptional LysR family regulator